MRVSEDFILDFVCHSGICPKDMRKMAMSAFLKKGEGTLSDIWQSVKTSPMADLVDFSTVKQLTPKELKVILTKQQAGTASLDELKLLRRYFSDLKNKNFVSDYKHDATQGMPDFMRSRQMGVPEDQLNSPGFKTYEQLRKNTYLNPKPTPISVYTQPYNNMDEKGFKRVLPWMNTNEKPIELNMEQTQGGY